MGYTEFLKNLFPDSHDINGQVYSAMLGAVGYLLDQYDPYRETESRTIPGVPEHSQNYLSKEFSVSTATGEALDRHGQDWGVFRNIGESDTAYRARILAFPPLYALGPTVAGTKAVVKPFTGEEPEIVEYGLCSFVIGETSVSEAGFCPEVDLFAFEVWVKNSRDLAYNHQDLENAVKKAKLARSRAIICHQGVDLSVVNEVSDARVTII